MNRINKLFIEKRQQILSIYFCAGHPTLEGTAETIETLAKNGIDMIIINGKNPDNLYWLFETGEMGTTFKAMHNA